VIPIIIIIASMLVALFYAEYRDQQREKRLAEKRLAATPRQPMMPAYIGYEVVELTDPIGSTLPNKENPMDAHQQYKLTEAVNRLLFAGAEVIELGDGRLAIAIPADVHPQIIGDDLNPSPLDERTRRQRVHAWRVRRRVERSKRWPSADMGIM
jgi:hypothetical protein